MQSWNGLQNYVHEFSWIPFVHFKLFLLVTQDSKVFFCLLRTHTYSKLLQKDQKNRKKWKNWKEKFGNNFFCVAVVVVVVRAQTGCRNLRRCMKLLLPAALLDVPSWVGGVVLCSVTAILLLFLSLLWDSLSPPPPPSPSWLAILRSIYIIICVYIIYICMHGETLNLINKYGI